MKITIELPKAETEMLISLVDDINRDAQRCADPYPLGEDEISTPEGVALHLLITALREMCSPAVATAESTE